MTVSYVGMGANLGDTRAVLRQALADIAALKGTQVIGCSSLYRTAPIDAAGPDYINAVAKIDTLMSAHQLLAALQHIELSHGRERPYRNAPRTLDLDILLYGQLVTDEPELIIPHPRMHQRAFVLCPLAELCPTLQLAQGSLNELLARCADQTITRLDDQVPWP